jgi:superfamily II DNA or RNA helicase
MSRILIRKYGNTIDLSYADGSTLRGTPLGESFCQRMSYTHITLLYGDAATDPITGLRRSTRTTLTRLYRFDPDGRLVTGAGYLPRLQHSLPRNGHEVEFEDLTPPRPNPNCFEPHWDNVRRNIEFRARQEECLAAINDHPAGIIDAPPAFGKSHLIAMIGLLYPRAKIDVVIRRKDLVQRTVRTIRRFLPSVGQVGGGKRERARVTIYTADSLHHSEGDADMLIADEVHELMTPKHSAAIARIYQFSRNYGLTATPDGRMDNADAKLEYLFGPSIFEMTWQEATALGLIVPIQVRWIPIRISHNPCEGRSGVPKKRWGLWRNQDRNRLIAARVDQHAADDQILILVETIEHAINLWQELPEFELCYGNMELEDVEFYKRNGFVPDNYEPVTHERREEMRLQFERKELLRVIATDIWSTGVSFEQLAVLVRADSRGSEILDTQAPGRVARIHEASGKSHGIVYDCDDSFDRGLKSKGQGRYRNYRKKGWEQIRLGDLPADTTEATT